MIGIITYISVLERTKEIGILRAIGASKKDISRVFNAETFIIGLVSGLIGIFVTVLITIPTSIIVESATGIPNIASLPVVGAITKISIKFLGPIGSASTMLETLPPLKTNILSLRAIKTSRSSPTKMIK